MKAVGRVLKKHREKQGITQGELAKIFKYKSGQYVSHWERGVAAPPLRKLPKLLKVLDVPRTSFMRAYLKDCKWSVEQCLSK